MTTNWMAMHSSQLRHTLLVLLLFLAATPALAHEHEDEISEEEANAPVDAILWIHMFLQVAVWGFLFPIGMVLGLSRSRWHVPLQVRTEILTPIHARSYQHTHRAFTEHGFRVNDRGILPRTHARRSEIPQVCPWNVREHRHDIRRRTAHARHLPQASHSRKVNTALCCGAAWDRWKGIPDYWLDSNVIWGDRVYGILQRGTFGTMFGTLHHGTDLNSPGSPLSYTALCITQGSGFIAYAIIMSIMLLVGEGWIRRKGRSPEFYDSLVITLWVCLSFINYSLLHAEWPGVGYRYAASELDILLTQDLCFSKHVHGAQGKHLVG